MASLVSGLRNQISLVVAPNTERISTQFPVILLIVWYLKKQISVKNIKNASWPSSIRTRTERPLIKMPKEYRSADNKLIFFVCHSSNNTPRT